MHPITEDGLLHVVDELLDKTPNYEMSSAIDESRPTESGSVLDVRNKFDLHDCSFVRDGSINTMESKNHVFRRLKEKVIRYLGRER